MSEEMIARALAMGAFAAIVGGGIAIARLFWMGRKTWSANFKQNLKGRLSWLLWPAFVFWCLYIVDRLNWGSYGTEPGDGEIGALEIFSFLLGPVAEPALALTFPSILAIMCFRRAASSE